MHMQHWQVRLTRILWPTWDSACVLVSPAANSASTAATQLPKLHGYFAALKQPVSSGTFVKSCDPYCNFFSSCHFYVFKPNFHIFVKVNLSYCINRMHSSQRANHTVILYLPTSTENDNCWWFFFLWVLFVPQQKWITARCVSSQGSGSYWFHYQWYGCSITILISQEIQIRTAAQDRKSSILPVTVIILVLVNKDVMFSIKQQWPWKHMEVCGGGSSFHVRVISTCAGVFVSICLTHMVVWVCVTFFLQ